ncbi:hydrogenase maturation protease [Bacillus mesophilus]|uniref:Hydrogenase maturation protease n=1 Tax=Bacillus mesophilus TaxID=1808955 RepID=A0A6M0QFA5_9BACI|nr:hydrogenase maturation protease [Bacillus mesophilus]MBM7663284.1 hydrogenase maturation protease [Bacillus mesophilus]NEY74068.1 hydrogenase maturation protease [Bacillus mesophilus]
MEKIIVLGIGNRLMMDDGIGIYLIEELSMQNRTSNSSFLIGESDIDYCMEKIMEATLVIIVDAVFSGDTPGEISVYPLAELHQHQELDISPHNFHLFQLLYLQRESIKGYLIGVEPNEIRFNIGLSKTLKEKWTIILQDVSETIERLIGEN